jgi:hypothetical protein
MATICLAASASVLPIDFIRLAALALHGHSLSRGNRIGLPAHDSGGTNGQWQDRRYGDWDIYAARFNSDGDLPVATLLREYVVYGEGSRARTVFAEAVLLSANLDRHHIGAADERRPGYHKCTRRLSGRYISSPGFTPKTS